MIGSIASDKKKFFESVRSLLKRLSVKDIEEKNVYIGKEPYVSRFVGDRVACIFGDTELCEGADLHFITDVGNGLIKTATENYLTAYAFLVSLRLIILNNDINDPDIEYLLRAPVHISYEDNIREFFEQCLWDAGWNLKNSIALMRDNIKRLTDNYSFGGSEQYVRHVISESAAFDNDSYHTNNALLTSYEGNIPYLFISYSHKNWKETAEIIDRLQSDGYRVWYDGRIPPGRKWDDYIASRIEHCECFIAFISREYLNSTDCTDEISYARNLEKPVLIIYLEDIEQPGWLKMRFDRIQSIFKYKYDTPGQFFEKLYQCHEISSCCDRENPGSDKYNVDTAFD